MLCCTRLEEKIMTYSMDSPVQIARELGPPQNVHARIPDPGHLGRPALAPGSHHVLDALSEHAHCRPDGVLVRLRWCDGTQRQHTHRHVALPLSGRVDAAAAGVADVQPQPRHVASGQQPEGGCLAPDGLRRVPVADHYHHRSLGSRKLHHRSKQI